MSEAEEPHVHELQGIANWTRCPRCLAREARVGELEAERRADAIRYESLEANRDSLLQRVEETEDRLRRVEELARRYLACKGQSTPSIEAHALDALRAALEEREK